LDAKFFLQSIAIGFSIAAPVGPIGVLCIRRTLANGRRSGLFSGLGAATADATYGMVAAFGLSFVSAFLINQQVWLQLVGGLFLGYLGLKIFLAAPAAIEPGATQSNATGDFASTFLLTLTNPATILSFTAIFAGLGLANTGGDYRAASLMVLGIFFGSALWWVTLSGVVGLFRHKFTPQRLRWVNRLAGTVILGFGLLILASIYKFTL